MIPLREWTKNQEAAIRIRGGGVYVSAAAGSGKTSVIVERVFRLVTDRVHPADADKLLIVTFTRAAANEMSLRIRARIDEALRATPKDQNLLRQSRLIRRAPISTVHAFCASLLREFWNEAGLPADFTVASDLFLDEMSETALRRTAEQLYADEKSGFSGFSDLFGRARSDDGALAAVQQLHAFLSDLADPKAWKERAASPPERGRPIGETPAGAFLFTAAEERISAAVRSAKDGMAAAERDDVVFENYGAAFLSDLAFLERLKTAAETRRWDDARTLLLGYAAVPTGQKRGGGASVREIAKSKRAELRRSIDWLQDRCFSVFESGFFEDGEQTAQAMQALIRAAELYEENLFAEKMQRKMIDYADLERLTIRLLLQDGFAAKEIPRRYTHLLVDEYQDTNEVQDLLFRLLCGGGAELFAVGDVKQSIYRFRRADPEIFLAKRREAMRSGGFPLHLSLTHNFRSAYPVIEAVNGVFSAVMTEAVGDVDYRGEETLTTLRERREDIGMEIRLFAAPDDPVAAEAKAVAEMIREMLASGCEVEENGVKRRCTPGDFSVLLRTAKNKVERFEAALSEIGIPVGSDGGGRLFESSEIELLLSLLTVVDNPKRDVEMAAVMLSPLFGFSPDDLLTLKRADRKSDLYSAMLSGGGHRTTAFLERLADWRLRAARMPADQLLSDIVDETDAELLLSAGGGYRRRRRNIRLLIDYASELSRGGGLTLSRFLRLLQRKRGMEAPLSGGFSPSAGAVSLLTVHKAKGLEWPFVILADAAKPFNLQDSRLPSVLFDRSLGAGFRFRAAVDGPDLPLAQRDTPQHRAIAELIRQKAVSEELRVLYVALTRAKQKVFVTAAADDPVKIVEKQLGSGDDRSALAPGASCYLHWILLSLTGSAGAVTAGMKQPDGYRENAVCLKSVYPDSHGSPKAERPEEPAPDAADLRRLQERIAYKNRREPLFSVPAKYSVSALSKETPPPLRAPFFMSADGVGAAGRGTAIHQFMQYADYDAAKISVPDELCRLVTAGYISEAYAAVTDTQKLRRFFESDLFLRISRGRVLLREYAFMDALDPGDLGIAGDFGAADKIMIQGIADCVVIEADGALLADYKSDRVKDEAELVRRYRTQLTYYKRAIEKKLRMPVRESYLYSFGLDRAIRLDL